MISRKKGRPVLNDTAIQPRGRGRPRVVRTRLSDRETQIITLLADGLSDKQAALRLDVSLRTVRFHFLNIKRCLKVRTRAHAVAVAIRQGLLTFGGFDLVGVRELAVNFL